MWYTHTMEYYLAINKMTLMPFAVIWMHLEIIILCEASQRQILYDIAYIQNLRKSTDELIYEAEIVTDIENKFMVTSEENIKKSFSIQDYVIF